jgi:hypothetical protein
MYVDIDLAAGLVQMWQGCIEAVSDSRLGGDTIKQAPAAEA